MAEGLAGSQEPSALPQAQCSGREGANVDARAYDHSDGRYPKDPDTTQTQLQGSEVNATPLGAGKNRMEPRVKGRGGRRRTDLDWRRHDR